MMRKHTRFPLVADNETIIGKIPRMNLYEESDLISDIQGPYQDKDYGDTEPSDLHFDEQAKHDLAEDLLPPLFEPTVSPYSRRERLRKPPAQVHHPEIKTQGQLAREAAREDLKRKRSAAYLRDEKPAPAQVYKRPVSAAAPNAKTVLQQPAEEATRMNRLANRLRQDHYILAELPAVYSLKKEDRQQGQAQQKNSYDFLRKSQVYNYPERKVQRERQMAQELNLTHIEEDI